MKKVLLALVVLLLVLAAFLVSSKGKRDKDLIAKPNIQAPSKLTDKFQKETKLIFVPYWTLKEKEDIQYDEIVYFGISVNIDGVDTKEPGFKSIDKFNNLFTGRKLLTLRMTNSNINSKILRDNKVQNKIIDETIEIAKEKEFEGIVFDFEISALPFDSLIQEINIFTQNFYKSSKSNDLIFYIALYGDTFYRARPYDVKFLSENSDKILIMTYDFHKAKGNPGPNFPMSGKEKYGYDLKSMIEDFSKQVPKDKLTVVFGMFGYDWIVDKDRKTEEQGKAMSLNEVLKMLGKCQDNCQLIVDNQTKESKIVYSDDLKKHEIWFETIESVEKKKMFLKEKGINQVGFWAYSYF